MKQIILDVNGSLLKQEYQGPAVYQIENTITGQRYVGATSNFKKRSYEHNRDLKGGYHNNKFLQDSFNSCDGENIVTVALAVEKTETAFAIEKELISEGRRNLDILNIRGSKPAPMYGRKMTDEQKQTMSKIKKEGYATGKYVSTLKGKSRSEESNLKQSESRKQLFSNGYENPFKGKQHSKENKEKQRQLALGQWKDPEFKELMREKGIERFEDPQFKNKIVTNLVTYNKSVAGRQKRSEDMKERLKDPEARSALAQRSRDIFKKPGYSEFHSQQTKIAMNNPEVIDKIKDGLQNYYSKPESIEKSKERAKEIMSRPGMREHLREKAIEQFSKPGAKEASSERSKKMWQDPEFKKKMFKPVVIDNVEYESVKAAQDALNISPATYYRRFSNK